MKTLNDGATWDEVYHKATTVSPLKALHLFDWLEQLVRGMAIVLAWILPSSSSHALKSLHL